MKALVMKNATSALHNVSNCCKNIKQTEQNEMKTLNLNLCLTSMNSACNGDWNFLHYCYGGDVKIQENRGRQSTSMEFST